MVTQELNKGILISGMDECTKTCHLSLKTLTNVSVIELVDDNKKNNMGDSVPNLRTSKFSTSDLSAFFNVLKSSLGSGILAMPYAFKNAGLMLGLFGTMIVGFICSHCTYILVFENHTDYEFNIRWYILLTVLPLLFVGTIRRMKYMAPFSAVANMFILIGVALVLYFATQDLPPIESRPLIAEYEKIPLFFCTVLFSMEGIGVILPIENAMKTPKHFLGYTGIFATAMYFVTSISVVVGFIGYVKFGNDVRGSITLNLPDNILAETVKILVAIAILFTYGLQVMAAADIIWRGVKPHFSVENETYAYYLMRVCMIAGHIIVAVIIPKLAPVISLIGAIGLTALGLALPAMIETLTFWEGGLGCGRWRLWKNIGIGILAVFTLISGTAISMKEIIETYS